MTAFVIAEPDQEPDTNEIMAFCKTRLAGLESPKRAVFVDDLPVTVGGKVLKYKLRAQNADLYAGE